MAYLDHLNPDHRLSQDECARIAGCAPSTIAAHRMAGLLPYIPTRPIRIRAGDLRVYLSWLRNGHAKKLHRSMHIEAEDAAVYSRLDGIVGGFTDTKPEALLATVISETDMLYKKYKALAVQRGPKSAANKKRHLRLHKIKKAA